ncbi:MAG: hypothetical protein AAGK77_06040 [Pseudomonadota bacterium]
MTHQIRLALCLLATLAFAACTASAPSNGARVSPADIVSTTVRVDTASFAGIEGRDINVPSRQIASDITSALSRRMDGFGPSNAIIDVRLDKVQLTSPGSAFAFGGPSAIEARVTVTDAESGAILFGPQDIRGTSEFVRLPGVIGVATSPTPERDYDQTVEGFAIAVQSAISGTGSNA